MSNEYTSLLFLVIFRGIHNICAGIHTHSFRSDAALRPWVHNPVVELQCVHSLENRADSPHTAVNVCVGQEVCRQVAVQPGLHCGRSVDPQGRVEEYVVQQLPGQKGLAERLRLA